MNVEALIALLRGRAVVALTGAGISTESGIPDYRGPTGAHRTRPPMQIGEFMESEENRRRYWARSYAGWPQFSRAVPNMGHRALAKLEVTHQLRGLITQNVDRLHRAAGSTRVVELHGALEEVRCMGCARLRSRAELQSVLSELNPSYPTADARALADGDAEVEPAKDLSFQVAACPICGGILKPNVVFFGETVPATWVESAWALYETAEVLLVVGSSLTVFSGFRFVRRAHQEGRPIAIINLGPTRGDPLATVKVEGPIGAVLARVTEALLGDEP